jgi:hypothetical protein
MTTLYARVQQADNRTAAMRPSDAARDSMDRSGRVARADTEVARDKSGGAAQADNGCTRLNDLGDLSGVAMTLRTTVSTKTEGWP